MSPGTVRQRHVLSACPREAEAVQRRILDALAAAGYDATACFAVRTAVEEALANAIHHGNREDPGKRITVEVAAGPTTVDITVADEGRGFDPAAVPDPTRSENVDIPSGRGLMLMRAYMSRVEFEPPGNRVRMTYRR